MNTDTLTSSSASIWERVIQFEGELSPAAARALLKLRYSQRALERMDALAAKAGQRLTAEKHRRTYYSTRSLTTP